MGRRAERPGIAWNCILAAAVTVAIDASVESSTKQCSFGIQEGMGISLTRRDRCKAKAF